MAKRAFSAASLLAASALLAACDPFQQRDVFPTRPTEMITVSASGQVTDQDGVPVGDAAIVAMGANTVNTTADANGHFDVSSIQVALGGNLSFVANKDGYTGRMIVVPQREERLDVTIKVLLPDFVPVDGSLSAALRLGDTRVRLGSAEDSGYLDYAKTYRFADGGGTAVSVELTWKRCQEQDIELGMAIMNGDQVSWLSGESQVITLPANGSGLLVVGVRSGAPLVPVEFTIQTKTIR